MDRKILSAFIAVIALLVVGVAYLGYSLYQQAQANRDMEELAALDKQEMEGSISSSPTSIVR